MWPWEHLAIGYLVYSLFVRYVAGHTPQALAVAALVVGTQFPDLIDKPLGWGTSLLPSGTSFAHSLFVAVPLAALAVTATAAVDRADIGVAFAIGYLLHLPADAVYPLLIGRHLNWTFLFWPLLPAPATTIPIVPFVRELAGQFLAFLSTPRGRLYLLLELGLLGGAILRWYVDGTPGLGWPVESEAASR
ncbi:metal-dependent hydrolase [Salinibaculum salinum]|uniref:metal-dependent hydrolase n=1 Tax=Salinibaculum salinum TaxID=3131996 RepID=UPI0030EF5082